MKTKLISYNCLTTIYNNANAEPIGCNASAIANVIILQLPQLTLEMMIQHAEKFN